MGSKTTNETIKKTIKKTIAEHKLICADEHIIIGLSGGPDSLCLFYVLNELREDLRFTLSAVHVNHGFRPGAAEEDQAYVEQLCQETGIECAAFTYDCPAMAKEQGLTAEEAGRKVRYEAFGKAAAALAARGVPEEQIKVAVAQNADDQAETVLLRLLRGSGTDGLAGMPYRRREGAIWIIRPLLDVWRTEIEAYCRAQKLTPRMDQTNAQPVYTRNKIRLNLLPYLRQEYNPSIGAALVRLSRIAAEDKDCLWACAEQAYERLLLDNADGHRENISSDRGACISSDRGERISLDAAGLAGQPPAIRRRIMLRALAAAGLTQDVSAAHLQAAEQELLACVKRKKAPGIIQFPADYTMKLQRDRVIFARKQEPGKTGRQADPDVPETRPESARRSGTGLAGRLGRLKISLLEHRPQTSAAEEENHPFPGGAAVFDWDKLCARHGQEPEIVLRTRQSGDYLSLKTGTKKIQNFFVDAKIPQESRDDVPLAAIGAEVLWVIARDPRILQRHRYSEQYRVDETTKKVLILEFVCGI